MKNFGHQLLSYVSGTIVEKRPSKVSGELEVWYQNGKYVLHSPDANYSFDTLHRVFQKTFKKLQVKKRNPKTVLILGFGAGSVASILCDELSLSPEITGVELDPEVIALARKYFNIDRFEKLTIHVADAVAFAAACNLKFDLVVSDVFVDKVVPEQILSIDYVKQLMRVTAKGGMGMMNIILEKKEQCIKVDSILQGLSASGVKYTIVQASPINSIISWMC